MSLSEIFCQDGAIGILQRAFAAGKMPHAYIFAGPEGVGKFKTAREWAKVLLCKSPTEQNGLADSCGSCESCRLFEADSHPDFLHVYKELIEFTKDGKGKKTPVELPIDVIREFLVDKVSNRPTLSERRVFVVSESEKLNRNSQNALMKVLEEPPGYCTIILLCTRMERLLQTTKSRCRTIRFGPVAEERIIEKLKGKGIPQDQARYWARLAQGSLGQACRWAELELVDAGLYKTKKELLAGVAGCRYDEALTFAGWLSGKIRQLAGAWAELSRGTSKSDINRRAQRTAVYMVISALHDAMKLSLEVGGEIVNFDQPEEIKKLAGRFGPEQLAEKIADCYRTLREIESNVNEKLVFEQLLLNLAASDIIKV